MTTPVLVYPDAVQFALTFLRAELPKPKYAALPYAAGVTVGSRLPDQRTLPFVWCRRVGGFLSGSGIDKARLDLHVYHHDEKRAHDLTQLVRGLLIAMPGIDSTVFKGAREFTGPGPVPDDLWPAAFRFYFTVELTLRATAI